MLISGVLGIHVPARRRCVDRDRRRAKSLRCGQSLMDSRGSDVPCAREIRPVPPKGAPECDREPANVLILIGARCKRFTTKGSAVRSGWVYREGQAQTISACSWVTEDSAARRPGNTGEVVQGDGVMLESHQTPRPGQLVTPPEPTFGRMSAGSQAASSTTVHCRSTG
jgi:hypothetical protein